QGDCVRSKELYEQSLAAFAAVGSDTVARSEASGHLRGMVSALGELGEVEVQKGHYAAARQHLERSWRIALQLRDRLSGAYVLERLAGLLAAQGSARRALRLAGAAAALRGAVGSRISVAERAMLDRWLQPAQLVLGEQAAAAALAQGCAIAP